MGVGTGALEDGPQRRQHPSAPPLGLAGRRADARLGGWLGAHSYTVAASAEADLRRI